MPIEIPADYYEHTKVHLENKSKGIQRRIEYAEKNGDINLANKHKNHLQRVEQTKKNLRRSGVSNKEAMFVRKHPNLSTAIDVAKTANQAGVSAAKSSALIGGTISSIQNLVLVLQDEKTIEDGIHSVVKDTTQTSGAAYVVTASSTIIKGAMKNSPKSFLQKTAKTNIPEATITMILTSTKTISDFYKSNITSKECIIELGDNSCSIAGGYVGASIGSLIGGPVGGMIGSMVGGTLTSGVYNYILQEWQAYKEEERQRRQAAFEAMMKAYTEEKHRNEVKRLIQVK